MAFFVDTALLAALCAGIGMELALQGAPQDPLATVAVVFAPWMTGGEAVLRATGAGSTLVKMGSVSFVVVVHPSSTGFSGAVRKAGGWLLLDAAMTVGCSRTARPPT